MDDRVRRLGIVGGGQLARMMALAARSLPVEIALLRQPGDEGAETVVDDVTTVDDLDEDALTALARRGDVVTFDHERTEPDLVARLVDAGHTLRPGPRVYAWAADKGRQRAGLRAAGLPVPPVVPVAGPEDRTAAAEALGWPLIVKSCRGGYDGAGVHRVDRDDPWPHIDGPALAEPALDLEAELAVLVARRPGGELVTYPVTSTQQDATAICRMVEAPAAVPEPLRREAVDLAVAVAEAADATGILAVELFVVDGALLVNELAARPHNTGHLTIEACATSQFENHVRAVLDLPLGPTDLVAPAAVMVNLLARGDEPLRPVEAPEGVGIHDYEKAPRPGRKVGHVTALGPDLATARERAAATADLVVGGPSLAGLSP